MKHAKIIVSESGLLSKPDQPPGKEIRKFRKCLRKTPRQFAKEFNIPICTLRRWEHGNSPLKNAHLFIAMLNGLFGNFLRFKKASYGSSLENNIVENNEESKNKISKGKARTILSALLPFCGPEILNCHHTVSCTVMLLGS